MRKVNIIINESQYNRLFQLNEGWNGPNFDTDHVNRIEWSVDFDEDELNDDLAECETEEDRQDVINDYYNWLTIEMECTDIDGERLGWIDGYIDDVENYFGEKVAQEIMSEIREKQQYNGVVDDILYHGTEELDYNDPDAVNAYAEKMFNEDGFSQYILPNGKTIGLVDHVYVSALGSSNVKMTKAKFMSYGNIRLGGSDYGSVGLIKEPTMAQYAAIKQYVKRYQDSPNGFEIHFCDYTEGDTEPNPIHTARYTYPQPDRIKYDIIHYFHDGIKPTGRDGFGDY